MDVHAWWLATFGDTRVALGIGNNRAEAASAAVRNQLQSEEYLEDPYDVEFWIEVRPVTERVHRFYQNNPARLGIAGPWLTQRRDSPVWDFGDPGTEAAWEAAERGSPVRARP